MRDGVPSGTSFLVALSRGLGVDHALDPLAADLLPPSIAPIVTLPRKLGAAAAAYRRFVRAMTLGLVDHNVLRTEAIDAHLATALRSGARQLVILGAGLDARAWRLEQLEGTIVFEVDHPATQRYKLQRLADMKPPTEIRYVSVDFEKERFSDRLRQVGFRTSEPSIWVWEGVAMYLPLAVVSDALSQLTSFSAGGSVLAMTYRVPGRLPLGALGRAMIPAAFAAAGEALKSTLEPSELASALAPQWQVAYDGDSRDWKALTGSRAIPPRAFLSERLAVLKKKD